MKKQLFKQTSLLLITLILSTSCASIFKGSSADVRVNSSPSGASVFINNINKGTTPQTMSLKRNMDYVLTFKKDGYEDVNVELNKKFDIGTAVVGNIFSWGLLGLIVDVATGAAYSLTPADIQANFDSMAEAGVFNTDFEMKEGEIHVFMLTTEEWEKIKAAQ